MVSYASPCVCVSVCLGAIIHGTHAVFQVTGSSGCVKRVHFWVGGVCIVWFIARVRPGRATKSTVKSKPHYTKANHTHTPAHSSSHRHPITARTPHHSKQKLQSQRWTSTQKKTQRKKTKRTQNARLRSLNRCNQCALMPKNRPAGHNPAGRGRRGRRGRTRNKDRRLAFRRPPSAHPPHTVLRFV